MEPNNPHRLTRDVVPSAYRVAIDTDLGEARFTGTVAIDATVEQPTDRIVCNAVDLTIGHASVRAGDHAIDATVELDADTERLIAPSTFVSPSSADESAAPGNSSAAAEKPADVMSALSPSKIGYLRISSFDREDIVELVEAAVAKIATCEGVILDLRGNSGGRMHQAMECCGFFLEQGQSELESAHSAARVFRGGDVRGRIAFTKDVVYLCGMVAVHTFLHKAIAEVQQARDAGSEAERQVVESQAALDGSTTAVAAVQHRVDEYAAAVYVHGPDFMTDMTVTQTLAISSHQLVSDVQRARTEQANLQSAARGARQRAEQSVAAAQQSLDAAAAELTAAQADLVAKRSEVGALVAQRDAARQARKSLPSTRSEAMPQPTPRAAKVVASPPAMAWKVEMAHWLFTTFKMTGAL